jgi:hypothetical protein
VSRRAKSCLILCVIGLFVVFGFALIMDKYPKLDIALHGNKVDTSVSYDVVYAVDCPYGGSGWANISFTNDRGNTITHKYYLPFSIEYTMYLKSKTDLVATIYGVDEPNVLPCKFTCAIYTDDTLWRTDSIMTSSSSTGYSSIHCSGILGEP